MEKIYYLVDTESKMSTAFRAAQLPLLVKALGSYYTFPLNELPHVTPVSKADAETFIAEEICLADDGVVTVSGYDDGSDLYWNYCPMPTIIDDKSINEIYEAVYNAYTKRFYTKRFK